MIGLPGESWADHQETVRLNRQCQPDGHHTGIYYPYSGTERYTRCLQQGLIQKTSSVRMERRQPIMDLPDFSKAQIKRAYTWFDYHVYRGHRPLKGLLAHALSIKMSSSPLIKSLADRLFKPLMSKFG